MKKNKCINCYKPIKKLSNYCSVLCAWKHIDILLLEKENEDKYANCQCDYCVYKGDKDE